MKALLDYVSTVTDSRQEKKVRHKMMDIIMLVFFATLANADDWVEIEVFGKEHEDFLRNYLELPYGIPSHDTIQRVFAIVPSGFLENFQKKWNELLNSEEGEKVKRLLAIDGKTQRGNGNKNQKETRKIRTKQISFVPDLFRMLFYGKMLHWLFFRLRSAAPDRPQDTGNFRADKGLWCKDHGNPFLRS